MDNPTIPNHFSAFNAAPRPLPPAVRRAGAPATLIQARIWLVVNLAAVAAVGAFAGIPSGTSIAPAWACFVILNALLLTLCRGDGRLGVAAARHPLVTQALAGAAGLGWGVGSALLLPLLDGAGLAVMLLAGFTVALAAVPAFSNERGIFYAFCTPLALPALAAIALDGRYLGAVLWIAIAAGCLVVLASTYYGSQERLRELFASVLALLNDSNITPNLARLRDAEISRLTSVSIENLRTLYSRNDRKRRILTALGDAIIATDQDGNIEYLNPVAEVLLGASAEELTGRPLEEGLRIVHPPGQRNEARPIFSRIRSSRRSQRGDDHSQLIRRDGVVYGIDYTVTPIRDSAGEFAGAALVLRDVTEKRHRTETIEWQASHDPLTGAVNRAELEVRIKKLLVRAQCAADDVHALLFIDIDNFKFVNDSYGHAAGDAILKTLADVLRTRIRGADTLGRMGGDEFAALLYSCSGEKARLIAEGLRIAVDRHEFRWQSIDIPLSLSIGIVEISGAFASVPALLRAADQACYKAKQYGRNRVHIASSGGDEAMPQTRIFDFVKDIQTAIHGNRLELYYQPVVAADGAECVPQCELSVGVRTAAGELMPRHELSDLARRYHLTEEIDRWTIKAVVDALSLNHPALQDMTLVLIPLSHQSVGNERMLEYITALFDEHPGAAERVGFALDHPELVSDLGAVHYFFSTLQHHGCRFLLGDFAFDSRALDSVKSLHPDFLGIRSELVEKMLHSSVDYEVVLGLSRIARTLGMKTIAAQADTRSQREALAKMGIDFTTGAPGQLPRPVTVHTEAQWI